MSDADPYPLRWDPEIPPRPPRLIEVADLGPGVRRLLYQARHGATDAEVRHAIETAESR